MLLGVYSIYLTGISTLSFNILIPMGIGLILGCFVFYGIRLVKYYKIYNPKLETGEVLENLASNIISTSQIVYEGDGLYLNN